MSRESNDAFDAHAERKGYKPRTWNYVRAVETWQEAWDAGRAALVKELEAERNTPGVTRLNGGKQ